jgi:Na+/H+-translocating membrane pyrophosphatase
VVVALMIGAFLNWQTAVNFIVGAFISASCRLSGHVCRRPRQRAHRGRIGAQPE